MLDSENLLTTGDGSHTLKSSLYGAAYHSIHGALNESNVVFIQSGLEFVASTADKGLRIFEMGFGTGLNAILTMLWAKKHEIPVYYYSVELHPLDNETIASLNYGTLTDSCDEFMRLHHASWNQDVPIHPYFTLHKHEGNILDLTCKVTFNGIYYDAFAPGTQPELWDEEAFRKMYNLLLPGGVLVSYCAQGAFKRNLKAAGFIVETLPGPPGKREMTRGRKL